MKMIRSMRMSTILECHVCTSLPALLTGNVYLFVNVAKLFESIVSFLQSDGLTLQKYSAFI